jgi:hypothetical protein
MNDDDFEQELQRFQPPAPSSDFEARVMAACAAERRGSVEATISRTGKIAIAVALLLLVAPIYLLSKPGLYKVYGITVSPDGSVTGWDRAGDAQTPERILAMAQVLDNTYREAECEEILWAWIDHYGGDETEKPDQSRFCSWKPFPWTEEKPRPPQHGEDYRKTPHPLTGKVLLLLGERLERVHLYQQATHVYNIIMDDTQGLNTDPEVRSRVTQGILRNGSGRNSF